MTPFKLTEFVSEKPHLFSSTFHEDFTAKKNSSNTPRWLEDVGIRPASVLGEGSFKNYAYERANAWHQPAPIGYAPLPGPIPIR
jgi:hypothetical protein